MNFNNRIEKLEKKTINEGDAMQRKYEAMTDAELDAEIERLKTLCRITIESGGGFGDEMTPDEFDELKSIVYGTEPCLE